MDPLKDIFDNYAPTLSPADDFMARLNARLDAVEDAKTANEEEMERVHAHMNAIKRRMHVATVAAFIVGFLSGAVCAYLAPLAAFYLKAMLLTNPSFTLPHFSGSALISPVLTTLPWIFTAAISIFAAMRTYEAILARPVADER